MKKIILITLISIISFSCKKDIATNQEKESKIELDSSEEKVYRMFNGASPYCSVEIKSGNLEFSHKEKETSLVVYDISPWNISSSIVRERLASERPIDNLLPPEVETYIIEHQIYKS